MVSDDKNKPFMNSDEDDSGTSSGGQGGKIAFVDFLDTHATRRDDALPLHERQHLLAIHKDVHEAKVKHQKEQIEQNKNVKSGKITLGAYRAAKGGAGAASAFKNNPELKNYGTLVDPKVSQSPNESAAETNPEKRDELQNKLRLGHQFTPKFNPKPYGP
jgi:hypothetical protein